MKVGNLCVLDRNYTVCIHSSVANTLHNEGAFGNITKDYGHYDTNEVNANLFGKGYIKYGNTLYSR